MTKTHKVGTLTLGSMLIAFGVLFLLRLFVASISYEIIFKLWPIIFIFLGLEILIANFTQKDGKLVYDTAAFVLIIILSFFAMGMAITDFCLEAANTHMTVHW